MRLNKFIAQTTGASRRSADDLIKSGKVLVNNQPGELGQDINSNDVVVLGEKTLTLNETLTTIMLNKPIGYVCSRQGQGSKTVYDLLPIKYHYLKPVGRLDKETSGLLLMTNDGELANELTHPSFQKAKIYRVSLNKTLELSDKNKLSSGVKLSDGMSKFIKIKDCSNNTYEITLKEGRNRQIRRTFNALGYKIEKLHRTQFGPYTLDKLELGSMIVI